MSADDDGDANSSPASTPVISVEEFNDNPCLEHCCPDTEEESKFLRVPDLDEVIRMTDQEQRRFSTGSRRLDRSAQKRVMKRRDTPPSSDPVFKLHLSPRGTRKVIHPLSMDALSETESFSFGSGKANRGNDTRRLRTLVSLPKVSEGVCQSSASMPSVQDYAKPKT
jgi:hypothetical protein